MACLAKALWRATGVPLLAGAAMALLLGACGKENQYVAPPPPKVIVQFPLQQTVTPYLEATGNVASENNIKLVARVEGYVQEIKYKDGDFVKSIGKRGNLPGEFSTPHTIANDAKGNIYVGDRGNSRIQVFDPELNPVRVISNVRSPWGICITPPNAQGQQFLFSADAGGKIYKTDLDGKLLGWFGSTGKRVGQFHWVHEMHCVSENELYVGEAQNWRVQRITMKK